MNTRVYSSPLASRLDRFLSHKRSLGFAYCAEARLLGKLDRLAVGEAANMILDEPLVRRFVSDGTRSCRLHRLTVVRQFARFLAIEEPRTFVPPRRFLGIRRSRPVIRILSRQEAGRFFEACASLPDSPRYPHRGLIYGTALRILLLTGMRRGELVALRQQDVDLSAGVLFVHRGKFGKSRYVPIAADVVDMLRAYDDVLGVHVPGRSRDVAFFPGPNGLRPCCPTGLYLSFRTVLHRIGIAHGGRGKGPRLHDLRHSFAVLRLLTWYEQDADLNAKLPLLATYLGHLGVETCQIYLHMTRDLVGEVTHRFEERFGDIITTQVVS
jgi:integrase/recombinase XerD